MAYLQNKQIPALRLNTDLFPGEIKFRYSLSAQGSESLILDFPDFSLDVKTVRASWLRKIWAPAIIDQVDETYQKGVKAEANTARQLLWDALEQNPCIDALSKVKLAEHKFTQLRAAQKAGLTIPASIYTTSSTMLHEFYHAQQGNIIGKLHNALSFSMEGTGQALYTTPIEEEMLDDLDMLEISPMIFQPRIAKAYELRVAYVNGQCFAGKIPETNSATGSDDWRNKQIQINWEAYELPTQVQAQLHSMMQELGLYFGAVDLICDEAGNYIFLEVNPCGEWGMLQKEIGFPIAETIAQNLINFAGYA